MQKRMQLRGNLMLLLTAMIWGSGFVAQSAGMDYVGPFTMRACRFLLSALVLLPIIALRDRTGKSVNRPVTRGEKKRLLVRGSVCGVLLFVSTSFQQFGLMYTTVGKSGFITAMYILIVPILGLLLGQKVGRSVWLGVVLSLVGLYFLCLSGGVGGVNLGDLLTLACALFFAMHIQYVARVGGETECVRMSCVQFLVNALLSAVGMALFESPSWSAVASCWLPILHAGVLSGGVAFTLQIVGQQYTSPTLASMLLSLESVFAAIFGAILIPSQALQGRELFGCALMFAAIVLAQLPQKDTAKAAETEQSTHR